MPELSTTTRPPTQAAVDGAAGPSLEQQREYWRRAVRDCPPVLDLTPDRTPGPRGGSLPAGLVGEHWVKIPDAVAAALDRLRKQERMSTFMVMLATVSILLSRHCGQDVVVVNAPAGGGASGPAGPAGPGWLPLRIDCGGEPVLLDLLRQVRHVVLDAFAHGGLTPAELSEALGDSPPSRQVSLTVSTQHPEPAGSGSPQRGNGTVGGPAGAELDLWFAGDARSGRLRYDTRRWNGRTIARWADQLVILLDRGLADPGQSLAALDILTGDDRQLLAGWQRPRQSDRHGLAIHPDGVTVAEMFEAQVAAHPDLPAVRTATEELSYAQLSARANRLAGHLRGCGVAPGEVVAVCVERTADPVVCFLAVLKAGAVYLPVDPNYPADRIDYILRDAGVGAVVATTAVAPALPPHTATTVWLDQSAPEIAAQPDADADPQVGPGDLAYLIYTSGSTGRPKGVEIAHRGLANLAATLRSSFDVGPGDVGALFSSISFDASIWEMVMALAGGAALAVLNPADRTPAEVAADLRRFGVTVGTFPPTFLRGVTPEQLAGVRLVIAAGEQCDEELVASWSAGRRFVNAYGPTEATVCATFADQPVADGRPAAIGVALPDVGTYVLDGHLRPQPVGVPGELCLDGVALARGYRGQPGLTAAAFRPNPYGPPGSRLYRTGDLVRFATDGTLRYLGRLDHQVKLRGFRIELSEIEVCLMNHPEVREAVVTVREIGGDQRLVAYLTGYSGSTSAGAAELRSFLSRSLPEYMVPTTYVTLPEFPLTASGKRDRRQLPEPEQHGVTRPAAAPQDPAEERIVSIWASELGLPQVSREDNFFELGGHSLVAAQVIGRVRREFRVPRLPMRLLFEQPVLAAFAAAVTQAAEQS